MNAILSVTVDVDLTAFIQAALASRNLLSKDQLLDAG
jgi:hypothetical protein